VPSLEMLIKAVEAILSILTKEGVSDHAIFLATDDAEAVGVFKRAFGCRLTVRTMCSARHRMRRKFTFVTGIVCQSLMLKMFWWIRCYYQSAMFWCTRLAL